jgi:hypothetical protein
MAYLRTGWPPETFKFQHGEMLKRNYCLISQYILYVCLKNFKLFFSYIFYIIVPVLVKNLNYSFAELVQITSRHCFAHSSC